jgi:hypothetical protein
MGTTKKIAINNCIFLFMTFDFNIIKLCFPEVPILQIPQVDPSNFAGFEACFENL